MERGLQEFIKRIVPGRAFASLRDIELEKVRKQRVTRTRASLKPRSSSRHRMLVKAGRTVYRKQLIAKRKRR